jgi:CHAT domain-containing protein
LWEARDTLKAIQVLSEEPYIPWELVHLHEPGHVLPAERHFLATKGLVRWVFNAPDAPCELKVRSGHGFYTIPDYPHADYKLPEARKEVTYLEGALGAQPLDLPSSQLVAALAERGRIDFYHFAGHGDADAQRAAEDARVMLTGEVIGHQYHPEYLEERQIRTRVDFKAGGTRPVVTLNACRAGRGSWNLTKVGGFAKSFVDRGAGAFVGALWEVGDGHARQFTEAFYEGLRANQTLSEAATAARLKAKASGESTWLAYVVYGYPHATVRFE